MADKPEKQINLAGILNSSHDDKWVAIAPDYSRVIAVADHLGDLMKSVKEDAVYYRVLPEGVVFAPTT